VQLAAGSIAVAGLVTVSVLAWQAQSSFSQGFAPGFVVTPLGWVNAAVPSGSCVVTDDAYLTLATDRFSASSGGCPEQVDAYGTWGVAYPSDPPPPIASVPKLTYQWAQMMSASDYVLLDSWTNDFVPWTRALDAWFHQNFTLVHSQGGVSLYRNEFVSPL
jgi:hypothetical protein